MTRDNKIIYESMKCWHEQGILSGIGKAMGHILNVSTLVTQAQQVASIFFIRGKKRCEGVRGKEHGECVTKYKVEGVKELIRRLSSSRGKCNQTKDSRACMEKINFKINQARNQLKRYQEILASGNRDQFA